MYESCITNRSVNTSTQLDELVAQLSARIEAGDTVDLTALTADCPHFREQLEMLLPTLQAVVELEHSLGARTVSLATPNRCATDDHVGRKEEESIAGQLGDFRILRELGRGGMGVVYEAEQISLGRCVALKVLPFAAMLDKQQLARFKNEARAAATLDHPNIVAIHSVGVDRGVHYYAMQLVEGQSLAQVIQRLRNADCGLRNEDPDATAAPNSAFPNPQSAIRNPQSEIATVPSARLSTLPDYSSGEYFRAIARLGIQAAEALDHAHVNGILHRDIKPANLLVDDANKLWVTDFGLARMERDAGMTMTGDLLGTLRYMSPEQALAKRVIVDHRSDVYSLGATLYELIAIQPVFPCEDQQELLRQIAFEEPRKLRQLNPRIPQDLETIIHKAIEKNPADRFATAAQLADDLRRHLADEPINAKPPGLSTRAAKWISRHRAIAASGVAILAVVVAMSMISSVLLLSERQRTIQASEESKAVQKFLVEDLLAAAQDETRLGREVTVGELLENANDKVGQAFVDQPEVEAAVRLAIAKAYQSLGRYEQSEAQAAKALRLLKKSGGKVSLAELETASILEKALTAQKKHDDARKVCEELLEAAKRDFGTRHPETIKSYYRLAASCAVTEPELAIDLCTEALELNEGARGLDRRDELRLKHCVAVCLNNANKYEQAYEMSLRTLEEARVAYGHEDRFTLRVRALLATTLLNQANRDRDIEDWKTQHARYHEVCLQAEQLLDIQCRVLGDLAPDTNETIALLAYAKFKEGKLDESYDLTMNTYELACKEFGEASPIALTHLNNIGALAKLYARVGVGKRSVELATLACELTGYRLCDLINYLAAGHARTGDLGSATKWAEKALEMAEDDHQRLRLIADGPEVYEIIAAAHARNDDFPSAIRWTEKVIELWPEHAKGPRYLDAYRKGSLNPD